MGDTILFDTLEFLRKGGNEIPEQIWENVENAILKTYVPQMTIGNERPCEESDFKKYLLSIGSRLKSLALIFEQIVKNLGCEEPHTIKGISKSRAVYLLLLCGEHMVADKWTTKETFKYSEELISHLCKLWQCKTILQLLIGDEYKHVGLFSAALLYLRPKLLKDTWKTYPAAVSCYQWLLFQIKSPHLSPHLSSVLPTALIILDDFVLDNRICGIKCLNHITDNVTRTELGWNGHGDVIYNALEPLLYQREAAIVEPLVSCLITVLGKVEGGYIRDEPNYKWSKYDDVLEKLLQTMEPEDRLALRLAYITSLPPLLEAAGLRMCRWSKRLLRVCGHYLEVAGYSQKEEAQHAILAVQVFIRHCWPLVPAHAQTLLEMLLRLLCDVTYKEETTGRELDAEEQHAVNLIEECLMLIVTVAPEETKMLCSDIRSRARFNQTFAKVIDRVFG